MTWTERKRSAASARMLRDPRPCWHSSPTSQESIWSVTVVPLGFRESNDDRQAWGTLAQRRSESIQPLRALLLFVSIHSTMRVPSFLKRSLSLRHVAIYSLSGIPSSGLVSVQAEFESAAVSVVSILRRSPWTTRMSLLVEDQNLHCFEQFFPDRALHHFILVVPAVAI